MYEAVARKVGQSALPLPKPIVLEGTNATRDATRVWTEGRLVASRNAGGERILQIQDGQRNFIARVALDDQTLGSLQIGSLLRLTGVYSLFSQNPPAFELLLNSSADIGLLARPPFWTLFRLSAVVVLLLVVTMLVLIWTYQLKTQVKQQTKQLEREITHKERAERDRVVERERSRIAQDLHDDLGSGLTIINMLAVSNLEKKRAMSQETIDKRLRLIADRSRLMVTALDEMVWAVNPKNDTIGSLVEYLASYAEEFLKRAEVSCKVELPTDSLERMVSAEVRHNVLLSSAEILNNAVRHGRPNTIQLRMKFSGNELEIHIQDNGSGFDTTQQTFGNGLVNLLDRMRKVGGCCRIESTQGVGTSVCLILPMVPDAPTQD